MCRSTWSTGWLISEWSAGTSWRNGQPTSTSRSTSDLAVAGWCSPGRKGVRWPEPPLRIATKYPAVARRHFGARGIPVELIRLAGAIELAPTMDLADAIVDLVETGATLRDNGLIEEEILFESSARVV